jgi:hypothetical protein
MTAACDLTAIQAEWRTRLAVAQSRYDIDKSPESKREYLRILGLFTSLVMRGEIPPESPAGGATK